MAIWTADRDQRLFLLLIEQVKVNADVLAAAWKDSYVKTGVDDYEPTPRAISEHIGSLKKSVTGNGVKKTASTPKSTPRKAAATKTPTTGTKRKRATKSSDEEEAMDPEDTDAERKMLKITPLAPRSRLSRRTKSTPKSYQEDDGDSDEDAAGESDEGDAVMAEDAGLGGEDNAQVGTAFDRAGENALVNQGGEHTAANQVAGSATSRQVTPQGKSTNGSSKSGGKRFIKREDLGDDSDGSDFVPEL